VFITRMFSPLYGCVHTRRAAVIATMVACGQLVLVAVPETTPSCLQSQVPLGTADMTVSSRAPPTLLPGAQGHELASPSALFWRGFARFPLT
jgi:hypothetical protein